MSAVTNRATEELAALGQPGDRERPRRRRRVIVVLGVLCVLAAAGISVAIINPFSGGSRASSGAVDNVGPTSLATVTQRALSAQTQVNATLGFAGNDSVVNQAHGTITALPAVGQVVSQGQSLYSVGGSPVVLLYGAVPAYRNLSEGASGADVQQLNADLVALGDAAGSGLDPTSKYFGSATASAVDQLQSNLGITQTGSLVLGQAVFLPSATRITTVSATLGGGAQPGTSVLGATSTTRQVTVALDAAQQSDVKVGDQVMITLPNNQTTPGVVSSVGTVATTPPSGSSGAGSSSGSSGGSGSSAASGSGSANPTIEVDVTPSDPAATGTLDQAPVQVTITTASVNTALVVPVSALLARSAGGYAVEVVGARGVHHLAPVSLGLFDDADGLVQVTGSGLSAGQRVVVPAQ